jgi:hypothetical protein
MRRIPLLCLMLLPLAAPAAIPQEKLATCREFAGLAEAVFTRRDAGVSAAQQRADWEKVTLKRKQPAIARTLMGNIVKYAYSPKARNVTPKAAKTEYFRSCLASLDK